MLDKFKNSNFYKKMKTQKGARAIYLTVVVLVLAVAIVTVITTAANKAKRNQPPIDGTTGLVTNRPNDTTRRPSTTTDPQGTTAPGTTAPETEATDVVSKIPEFALPVTGNLIKSHDDSVQVWSSTMSDYRVHLGLDIATAEAAPVYAAAKGTISKVWEDTLMGYCIAIEHGGDSMTIYKNLQKDLPTGIAEGVSVTKGQLIAVVGNSAMIEVAEDPHLHFEITVAGLQVDPLEYFNSTQKASLAVDSAYED
jgi:murein DD-endopeptidase MepM/ murein hydrolase activator NlpD